MRDDRASGHSPAVPAARVSQPAELTVEQTVPLAAKALVPSTFESSAARAVVVRRPDTDAVIRTLTQYADAMTHMDVGGAVQAWPSVDHRALSDAFKTLDRNGLALNGCAIEVGVGDTVVATCRARVEYVPKVGSRSPRLASQQWRFTMSQVAGEWKIQTATVKAER